MANFLTQIRQAFVGAARYVGGFRLVSTRAWGVGESEVYAEIESDNAVKKGFNANAAVYSIVKKYAKKAASIEHYLEKISDETTIENHPLQQLLDRPNPKQSSFSFFKSIYAFYKVCGEAFIWLNRGDVTQMVDENGQLVDRTPQQYMSQPVIEMWIIPSNEIVVLPENDDPYAVRGYQLRNRPDIKFPKADIIHWMDINLEWDELGKPQLRGMSPLKPGYKTLTADNSLIDSMVRMAQNDGAKGAIVNKTLGKRPTPEQQTQIDMVIKDKINNKVVKNAVAALEGDWSYLDFGLTAVDMDTLAARDFIYKEMCFLLDVPYGFFDSHTPYAEKQLAARDWISNSIKPDVRELDTELERFLLPAFGLAKISDEGKIMSSTAKICSDFDSLPELQEDKAKQVEWLMKAPLTPNEVREALEYEPITGVTEMDEVYIPSGIQPIQGDPMADPNQLMTDIQTMSDAANGTANRAASNGKVSYP